MMSESNESSKKGIKVGTFILIIFIGLIIPLGLWTIGYFNNCSSNNIYTYFKALPEFISKISTFFATIIGIEIVTSGVFTKGTPWYPRKYGYCKLRKVFRKYDFPKSNKEYMELKDYIDRINPPNNNFTSQYYKCVFALQETSFNFKMVWNDFNYYGSVKKPSKRVHDLLNKIRQYIYLEVKKYNIEIQEKKDR